MESGILKKMISLCLAVFMLSATAFTAVAEETAQDGSSKKAVISELKDNGGTPDYYDYKESLSGEAAATGEIKVKIGKTLSSKEPVTFSAEFPQQGLYAVAFNYKATDSGTASMECSFKVDRAYPFSEAEKLILPRIWRDGEKRFDGMGNQIPSQHIAYDELYRYTLTDTYESGEPYLFLLSSGVHEISIAPKTGEFYLEEVIFSVPQQPESYSKPQSGALYSGDSIIIEGEDAILKSDYSLVGKSDNSSAEITPNSTKLQCVNYIGGSNWNSGGETITWETPELEAGYYRIGFSFRQGIVLNGVTYRMLTVDGKVPFSEAGAIPFEYSYGWQQKFFSDSEGTPYLVYFSEGKHQIALSVVSSDMNDVCRLLNDSVSALADLYLDINMITGENIDVYRDYELFSQISDMQDRLKSIAELLEEADELLYKATGYSSGSNSSVIKGMLRVVKLMLENKYIAHRYVNDYYTNYCSLAATLQDIDSMPLDLDKISLCAADCETPFKKVSGFTQAAFSIKRFLISFVQDYNSISANDGESEAITVWVNWGRDQAQILNSLVSSEFTENTGIGVNIKIVNATMVQAVLSGKGPDCTLQNARSEPVNLAMRGVLCGLSQFDDLNEVLKRFQDGAEDPYYYKGELYALPDTQSFSVMYYRTDIFKQLGLSVPETWNDFESVCVELIRNNMTAWLPIGTATEIAPVFPSMLMQNGIPLYAEDGKTTLLSQADVSDIFGKWMDYYTKLKIPYNISFYNRFRTGTCPIGIDNYTLYATLKAAATEIDGLWNIAQIPGTVSEDGTVSHTTIGSGTGCAILSQSKHKAAAWEFLKWWTDAETQLRYSNELESVLGPTGRVALSNVEALTQLSWDPKMQETITTAWSNVKELPEYPGSYYVSRAIYQSFWNVANKNENAMDVLAVYSKEANEEIQRKWKQYDSRG